jgi:hypothetical protein
VLALNAALSGFCAPAADCAAAIQKAAAARLVVLNFCDSFTIVQDRAAAREESRFATSGHWAREKTLKLLLRRIV